MKEQSSHKFIWFELRALLALVALALLCVPTPHSTATSVCKKVRDAGKHCAMLN